MLTALENQAIDAAHLGSPYSEKAKSLGYAVTIQSMHDVVPGFQKGFMMYGRNLLENNPALGEKFMVAFLKGVRQFSQGRTERNLEIIEKYLKIDRETLATAPWDPIYPDGRIMTDDILAFQDWSYQNGFMDNKVAEAQLTDIRFIEYAKKVAPAK
jgi:NitT/TauT family transport system substrate-binding protein